MTSALRRLTSMTTAERVTMDLRSIRQYLNKSPYKYQVRWVPATALLVDAFMKHLIDRTILADLLCNSHHWLREDP